MTYDFYEPLSYNKPNFMSHLLLNKPIFMNQYEPKRGECQRTSYEDFLQNRLLHVLIPLGDGESRPRDHTPC